MRNLKAIAILSNPQHCAVQTQDLVMAPSATKIRSFCQIELKTIEKLFEEASSNELTTELNELREDTQTPLDELKRKHFSCVDFSLGGGNEIDTCIDDKRTQRSFAALIKYADDFSKDDEQICASSITSENYPNLATAHHSGPQGIDHVPVPLKKYATRYSVAPSDDHGVFLFDFMPESSGINFKKGDSGSLLNIYGGYPVAALSTVDGEPTSGGSGLTPLPEPQDDDEVGVIKQSQDATRACD